jgi:hypothetical protein
VTAVLSAVGVAFYPHEESLARSVAPASQTDLVLRTGESRSLKFTLRNPTSRAIQILSVQTSCTCTSHQLSKSALLPGEECELELLWHVRVASGPASVWALVVFQCGIEPVRSAYCSASGHVPPRILVSPSALRFSGDDPAETTLQLTSDFGQFKVLDLGVTDSRVTARVIETQHDGRSVLVQYAGRTGAVGTKSAELTIRTSDEVQTLIRIPISFAPAVAPGGPP